MGASATSPAKFTDHEKQLLRTSWKKVMENRVDFSVEIFLEVFKRLADSQAMFEQLKKKSIAELKTDKMMKAHCIRVSAMMNTMVLELDDAKVVVEMLRNIGRTHIMLGNKIGEGHYNVFGVIFLECIKEQLGGEFKGETKKVWERAFEEAKLTLLKTKEAYDGKA